MGFVDWANKVVKKFTITDIFLIELSSLVLGVLLVVLVPSLTDINIWWLVAAVVVLAAKPLYTAIR
mgnify:CR=1 FL=1